MSVVALFTFMYGQVKAHNFWHNRDIYFPISFSQENCAFKNVKNLTILLPEIFEYDQQTVASFRAREQYLVKLHSGSTFLATMLRCGQRISYLFAFWTKKKLQIQTGLLDIFVNILSNGQVNIVSKIYGLESG